MLSDEVRRRLAQLYTPAFVGAPGSSMSFGGAARQHAPAEVGPSSAAGLFDRAELCQNASGSHLRFRRPLASLWPGVDEAVRRHGARATPDDIHPDLAALAGHFPQRTLFLDLETCGFAGSSVFLAGVIWRPAGSLVVDQLFARHWGEERALLETLWQIAAENRVLVTFNGKSFDWPMVHDRSTRHHLGRDARGQAAVPGGPAVHASLSRGDHRPELVHCDLLHHARRRWKRLLPNCKLQTLERYVCRRGRRDDLSGAQVPLAYHEYVRSGAAGPIGAILRHNALDLATLVQLALVLASV